jgi:RimJ/RimL family protein N-acetyltransferase
MLQTLAELVFGQTPCHRLHLGVFPENIRAQRAYKAVGFKPEGIARGSTVYNGVPRDELIMARLRGDAAP